jgi:F-type H+-transporting ATPase subunit b
MEIIQTTALITINDTLWLQLLSFLAFLFVINRVMFRPVLRTMAEREDHLEAMHREIADTTSEMDRMLAEAAAVENRVRADAHRQRESLLNNGRAEAGQVLDAARDEIRRLRTETEARMARELTDARQHIEGESMKLATDIMEAVLERRLK